LFPCRAAYFAILPVYAEGAARILFDLHDPDHTDKIRDCGVYWIIFVSGTGCVRYNTKAYADLFTVLKPDK
jgi:hypothetical protein